MDKLSGIRYSQPGSIGGFNRKAELEESGEGRSDAFVASMPEEQPAPSMSSISSALFNSKGLSKRDFKYSVKDHALGADGTVYAAYQDPDKPGGNYICALNPDKSVKWEVSGGSGPIHSIKAGPDGTLFVRSEEYIKGFDADGIEIFNTAIKDVIDGYQADSRGNNFLTGAEGIHIIDRSGNEVKVSDEIRGIDGNRIKEGAGDTRWCRYGDRITPFDISTGRKGSEIEFKEKSTLNNYHIDDFYPVDGDKMLIRGKRTDIVSRQSGREYDDIHHGLHFGRPFGGFHSGMHLPPLDSYSSSSVDYFKYFAVDSSGNKTAESRDMGFGSVEAFSKKNQELIIAKNSSESANQTPITAFSAGGERDLITLEGSVRQIHVRESDGHVFVIHNGDRLTSLDSEGKPVHKFSLGDLQKGMKILKAEDSSDGGLIMVDGAGQNIFRWDMNTGFLNPLTDHSKDYSFKAVKIMMERESANPVTEEAPEDPKVVVEEKFVIIDGIKLEINE